jgi:hypothetical protein
MSIDEAGNRVLRFVSAAQNLTQIGELTSEVTEIAKSGSWRRYRTGLGEDEWRACEFDYFLIACNLSWDDVSRVVVWTKAGGEIAPLMDREASRRNRRPLEEAAKTWHAASTETLVQRAIRLGWTRGESGDLRVAPLPPRVRAKHTYGVTMDEHARTTRIERVSPGRRQTLDALIKEVRSKLDNDLERLYVIDALRRSKGRPSGDRGQWAKDVAKLNGDTKALAEYWGLSVRQAQERKKQIRE